MTKFAYARVSSSGQTTQQQVDALRAAGVDLANVVTDEATSGTTRGQDRPGYAALSARLAPGDELVVVRLDRLGRSVVDVLQQVQALTERGVVVRSLSEGIDSSTPAGRMVLGVFASLAEYERELMLERQRAALEARRSRGQPIGRKPALTAEQRQHARQLADEGRPHREIARLLKVGKGTVQRALQLV